MSTAQFDVRPIQERLRAGVPQLRSVQGAADYAAVTALRDFPAPCAYVVLAKERGAQNPPGNAIRGQVMPVSQVVEVVFGVVLVVRNYREQRGAQVVDELGVLLAAVRNQLLGFVPDVIGARACQLVQGDLLDYDGAMALWAESYTTQHMIRSTP